MRLKDPVHFLKTGRMSQIFVMTMLLITIQSRVLSQKSNEVAGVINQTKIPNGWLIQTDHSSYQLFITSNNQLKAVYYGSKAQAANVYGNADWQTYIDEVPVRGGVANKSAGLEVVFADGVRDADLEYVKGEVVQIRGRNTLKLTQKDRYYPLEVISYIRVLPEFDVIEKWVEVINKGNNGNIKIDNLQSGSIVLPTAEYNLTQLAGRDINEFQLFKGPLTPGVKLIQNKVFKTNANPPWFMVQTSTGDEHQGATWFGSLHYSGNWQLAFDKQFNGPLQILGGINFWDQAWYLKPGEKFTTPILTLGYSANGSEKASQDLAAYVRADVLPASFRNEIRPVIYNSWEATYYNVNEENQLALVQKAKEIGAEIFTIDDGWFKGRTDGRSQSGLGNWFVDSVKFPHGLTPVIDAVHKAGMKFGLWVEPENANPNSDMLQKHPDWYFQYPHRPGNLKRKVLNFANPQVYQYILDAMTKILKNNAIDYIKWDQNNAISEAGWMAAPSDVQQEVRIIHIQKVYELVSELRRRFPKVMFESCSGGGGRVDLGMLSLMDQAWPSDNTDPLDRLFIQYGYLSMLPANTMISWVTSTTRHLPVSLDYRFDVSMAGVLGIGSDIRKWTTSQIDSARKKIELYKKIRPVIQKGVLYKLVSPFNTDRCALQYNSTNGDSSVVFCYNLATYLSGSQLIDRAPTVLKLQGLQPDKKYQVQQAGEYNPIKNPTVYRGDFLMQIGIKWPLNKPYESKILTIEQVGK